MYNPDCNFLLLKQILTNFEPCGFIILQGNLINELKTMRSLFCNQKLNILH